MNINNVVVRGEVYITDFTKIEGLKELGVRPTIIISDKDNERCRYVQVMAITSVNKSKPWHVEVFGLKRESYAMPEQIYTIKKELLYNKIHILERQQMTRITLAIIKQIGGI